MIYQTQTTAFKSHLYQFFLTDNIYIALYTANATLDENTTVYTTTGEVVASGYTAGGQKLLSPTVASENGVVYVSFANPVWSAALTARGALIYNASNANQAIAVLDFGADKFSSNTFTVTFPANTADSAVIRSSN